MHAGQKYRASILEPSRHKRHSISWNIFCFWWNYHFLDEAECIAMKFFEDDLQWSKFNLAFDQKPVKRNEGRSYAIIFPQIEYSHYNVTGYKPLWGVAICWSDPTVFHCTENMALDTCLLLMKKPQCLAMSSQSSEPWPTHYITICEGMCIWNRRSKDVNGINTAWVSTLYLVRHVWYVIIFREDCQN